MSYEVDVRAVGQESKSGDAIVLRYGDFSDRRRYRVVVIDGGFVESGEDLVNFIKTTYGTSSVDLVISTHPDADHCSGLETLVEQLEVGELWMHQPWNHVKEACDILGYRGQARGRFDEQLELSLSDAADLETIAKKKGIPIREPFDGVRSQDGCIMILGPTEEYYEELLAGFEDPSKACQRTFLESVEAAVRKAIAKIRESWDSEVLVEPDSNATRPQNNSSAIILARLDSDYFLFTGDAGVPAQLRAIPEGFLGMLEGRLKFVQLPHHGSKRNIGPTTMDRILGPKLASPEMKSGLTAFVSAAKKGAPKHPAKRVTNAANRRGAHVLVTQGSPHCYRSVDAPARPNWGPIATIEFCENYEED